MNPFHTLQDGNVTGDNVMFPITTRNMFLKSASTGLNYEVTGYRAIVASRSGAPHTLSVVTDTYNVVPNRDLFHEMHDNLTTAVGRDHMREAKLHMHSVYGGRDCYLDYTFPSMPRARVRGGGDIAPRVIIGNSYGGNKPLSVMFGAIDFFCTNGMIFGDFQRAVKKHTSGATIKGMSDLLVKGMIEADASVQRLVTLSETVMGAHLYTGPHGKLTRSLHEKEIISKMAAERIMQQAQEEARKRCEGLPRSPNGQTPVTLWHLHSAATDWATHAPVRDTGNNHEFATRITRSKVAERIISHALKVARDDLFKLEDA